MPSLSQGKIRELHTRTEDSDLDWKSQYNLRSPSKKAELAKDVCAIANYLYQTSGRGYLVIGTDDNGTPISVNPSDYPETTIQQIVTSRTDPPPIFNVHHVVYTNLNLVIIDIRRSTSGPHQVVQNTRHLGFPIRRGSTTDWMSTNEVFQAMQARGRSFSRRSSEYETLSQESRYHKIIDDCVEALHGIGFGTNSVKRIEERIRYVGRYVRSRFIVKATRRINHREWIFHFLVNSDEAPLQVLYSVDSYNNFTRNSPPHRSIIIYIAHGSVSSSYFTRRRQFSSHYNKVGIEPKITYFGLGEGTSKVQNFESWYLPKFFVSNVKSKDDIKMRIELILKWIEQHRELFEDIRLALS
ncbi:MAG: hypothetical protein AM326_05960 [Candidatus Thorarchaeota archaeon SMTZ-45]|nr:MAG: hypothetical protein AM325_01525 [Candidatus Thorarchaeota archaeon SMTZ1-45]KXH77012.1 MAG: hypothetical protein AM326_05960 [Candidatus Thorarchaeota archaeon SMTZ-45]